MKGTMTRLGVLLLALALLAGPLAGCGRNNPSVLQLPQGTAAPENKPQETPAPLTPLGDRTCYVGKETIPESTLFSFILTAADFDPLMGLTLKFSSTNKSPQRAFVVSMGYLSVNGYMQDANYEARVPANQTVAGEILISAENLRSAGVSSVDELILYPLIYDPDVPMGQGDAVDGAFSFFPTGQTKGTVVYPVRQRTTTEQAFFDNGIATMIILDAKTDGAGDLVLTSYLENKTDRFLSFSWSDVAVDGTSVSADGDTLVAPAMRRYAALRVPAGELSARGITAPGSMAFKMAATPLSSTGATLSPLMEQRGTYRFSAAGTATPDDEPAGTGDTGADDEPVAAVSATASPAPTKIIYTSPTTAHKRNAKHGYVNRDQVNMRSGPGTQYKTVGKKIDINSTALLYELQDGWWFLKCNNKYGYVKADYVSQGKPKATAKPDGDGEADGKTSFAGTVTTQSTAALRKEANKESKCLKEMSNGTKVTVYYKTKGKDGKSWYYVAVGKTKGYVRSDLVKVKDKVPSK